MGQRRSHHFRHLRSQRFHAALVECVGSALASRVLNYRFRVVLLTLIATCAPCTSFAVTAATMAERADFWSFKPIVQPRAPGLRNPAWVRNPIDAFILARLEKDS